MLDTHKTRWSLSDSTTEQQQQLAQDVLDNTTSTTTIKPRKRKSTSSNGSPADKSSRTPHHRSGAFIASRTVQRSSAGPSSMSTVNYTKTGRVSKAKKGLKVHDCECGRSYTRAEHLRRHQRNHAQEDIMTCRYPSCSKTFFRADLLQRHEERHDELGNMSRQPSISGSEHSSTHTSPRTVPAMLPVATSVTVPSAASFSQQQYSMSPRPEVASSSRYNPSLVRAPQPPRTPNIARFDFSNPTFHSCQVFKAPTNDLKRQISTCHSRHSISGPVLADAMPMTGVWPDSFAQSPYSCSSGYASPVPGPEYSHIYATPPYATGVVRTRASSNASFLEQTWAHASQSPTSSASVPYSWPPVDKCTMPSSFAYVPVTYSTSNMASLDLMPPYAQYDPHNVVQMDNEEGTQLFPGENYGMSQISRAFPFEQWLNNYWRLFHPTFPIVHRFTLTESRLSPMLYAAMIAIDLQLSHDASRRQRALEIHKTCTRLLQQREQLGRLGCNRLCDDQSIFLVEVFSQYCAQRCSRSLSTRFELVYEKLANIRAMHPSATLGLQLLDAAPEEYIQDRWIQWSQLAAKQNLLLSCFVLESQQRTLLARNRYSTLHTTIHNLPFPVYESLWNATTALEWTSLSHQQSDMPRTIQEAFRSQCEARYDIFQSAVLVAASFDQPDLLDISLGVDIKHLLNREMITQLHLLTAKLAQLAPLQALLCVSGETWVLGTKLSSKEECDALRSTLHGWIEQVWSSTSDDNIGTATEALKLSVIILQMSLDTRKPLELGLGGELGLFLAALVLWSATAAATRRSSGMTFPIQDLQSPVVFDPPFSNISQSEVGPLVNIRPTIPAISSLPERRSSIPCVEIFTNISRFLPTAVNDISSIKLAACQLGCTSLLLWVRMHLRGTFSSGPRATELGGASIEHHHGELVNAAISQIERMLDHGWDGWGI